MKQTGVVGRGQNADWLFVMLAGVGTVLSRLPFRASLLNSHDAVNYALALDRFDMRLHQPQPPGYPLYVLLGRAFNLVFHDHLTSLVWLSIVCSGLAVATIYLVGKEMFGRRAGVLVAMLVATSSLFWYQGELASPYTADFFVSVVVGWFSYRAIIQRERGIDWGLAIAVGLAGAFRLQTIMVLGPLFLFALRGRPWKTIAGMILIAGGILGLFFVPAVMVSGGPASFVRSMRITVPIFYSKDTFVRSAQVSRYIKNVDSVLRYTLFALGELAVPFVLVGYLSRPHSLRFWRDDRLLTMALWLLPTWVLYFLVAPGNAGTILVCMPPVFLLAAAGLDWALGRTGWIRATGQAVLTVLLVWQIVLFTVLPWQPFGAAYRAFHTQESISLRDEYHRTKLSLVEEVPTEGTVVFANDFRLMQYYLPQYRTFSAPSLYRSDPSMIKAVVSVQNGAMENWSRLSASALVPPGTERIVFYDLPSEAYLGDPAFLKENTENGYTILVISVPDETTVLWTAEGIMLRPVE